MKRRGRSIAHAVLFTFCVCVLAGMLIGGTWYAGRAVVSVVTGFADSEAVGGGTAEPKQDVVEVAATGGFADYLGGAFDLGVVRWAGPSVVAGVHVDAEPELPDLPRIGQPEVPEVTEVTEPVVDPEPTPDGDGAEERVVVEAVADDTGDQGDVAAPTPDHSDPGQSGEHGNGNGHAYGHSNGNNGNGKGHD